MTQNNNILNRLLAVAFLIMLFQAGCATTTVKETPLLPTEAVETTPSLSTIDSGTGLAEITDPNQIPDFPVYSRPQRR